MQSKLRELIPNSEIFFVRDVICARYTREYNDQFRISLHQAPARTSIYARFIPKRESENTSARIKVRHAIIPRKGFRVYVSTQKVPGGKAISQRYIALPRHRHKVHEERGARFRVNVKRNRSGEQPLRSVSRRRDEFLSL